MLWLAMAGAAAPISAQDAVVRGSTLVYVNADGTEVIGHHLPTEKVTWRVPLGDATPASVAHVLDGNAVMVQANRSYTTIDASNGEVLLRREAPPSWEFVHRGMGGCGLVASCTLQPIDCADGHPLGPLLRGPTMRFRELEEGGGHSGPTCVDDPTVLAAAAGVTVVRVPTADDFGGESELAGLRREGRVWASAGVSCKDCEPLGSGAAPDGSLCWTTDEVGPREVLVRGFTCSTGAALFERSVPVHRMAPHVGVVTGWWKGGLLVSHGRGAVGLDAATGAERWQTKLVEGELAVVEGLRVPSFPLELEVKTLVTLDGATGVVLGREPVPNEKVVSVVAGRVVVEPSGRSGGRGGGGHIAPLTQFEFERGKPSRVLVDGKELRSWPGDAWVVGEVTVGEGAWLVVHEVRSKGDRLHIVHR